MDDNNMLNKIESLLQKSLQHPSLPDELKQEQQHILESLAQFKAEQFTRGSICSTSDNGIEPNLSQNSRPDSLLRSSFHGQSHSDSQNNQQSQEEKNFDIQFDPLLPPCHTQEYLAFKRNASWAQFKTINESDGAYVEVFDENSDSKILTWRSNSYPTLPHPRPRNSLNSKNNPENKTRRHSGGSSTSYESYEDETLHELTSSSKLELPFNTKHSKSEINAQKSPTTFQSPTKWESKSTAILEPPVAQYKEKKRKKSLKINLQSMISAIPAINLAPNTTLSRKREPLNYKEQPFSDIDSNATSTLHSDKSLTNQSQSHSIMSDRLSNNSSSSSINTQQYGRLGMPIYSGFMHVRKPQRVKQGWVLRLAVLTSQSLCFYKVDPNAAGAHGNVNSHEKQRCISVTDCGVRSKSGMGNQLINVLFLYGAAVFKVDKLGDRRHVLKIDIWEDKTIFVALSGTEELEEWKNNLTDVIAKNTFALTARDLCENRSKSDGHSSKSSVISNPSNENSPNTSNYYSCPPVEKSPSSGLGSVLNGDGRRDIKKRFTQLWNNLSKRKSLRSSSLSNGIPSIAGKHSAAEDTSSIYYSGISRDVFYRNMDDNPSGVSMAGNLMVQSVTLGDENWHHRFCLISRGMFSVFKKKEDIKPQINFPLFGCCLDYDPCAINRCIIIIMQGKQKKVAIETSDSGSLGKWMSALVRVTLHVMPPPNDDEDEDLLPRIVNSLSEEEIVKKLMEVPTQGNEGYETSINDQLLNKLSVVRQHLLRSCSKHESVSSCQNSEFICSTLPHFDTPTPGQRLKRRRSNMLRRSYESMRHFTNSVTVVDIEVTDRADINDKSSGGFSSHSSSTLSDYSLAQGIVRKCYSTEELNSPIKTEELCKRAANDLLPCVFQQRLKDIQSRYFTTVNNTVSDYELVSFPSNHSGASWSDRRDSAMSESSLGINEHLSESQSGLYVAGAPCSSTSAYSSMYHSQSRPDSSHLGDLCAVPISLDDSEHEGNAGGDTLRPSSNQEAEYNEALEMLNKRHPELLLASKDATLRPPLPVRSKTRRSIAAAEFEAMASKFGKQMRKLGSSSRPNSQLISSQHHQSLSNVSMKMSATSDSSPPIVRSQTETNLDQQPSDSISSIPSQISVGGGAPRISSMLSKLTKKRSSVISIERSNSLKRQSSTSAFASISSFFTPGSRRKKISRQLDQQIKEEIGSDDECKLEQGQFKSTQLEQISSINTKAHAKSDRKVQSLSRLDILWNAVPSDKSCPFFIRDNQILTEKKKMFSSDSNLSFPYFLDHDNTSLSENLGLPELSSNQNLTLHQTNSFSNPAELGRSVSSETNCTISSAANSPNKPKLKPARPDKPPQYANQEKRIARLSSLERPKIPDAVSVTSESEIVEESMKYLSNPLPNLESIPPIDEGQTEAVDASVSVKDHIDVVSGDSNLLDQQ